MALLEIRGLSVRFGGLKALDNVSLSVESRGIRAIIGPNGAGKTTLFNTITGLVRPNEGEMLFRGRSLSDCPPHSMARLGITRTFQNLELYGGLNALQTVQVGYHSRMSTSVLESAFRVGRYARQEAAATEKARSLLAFVGLERHAEQAATSLPFGYQRLLELARAMAAAPELVLLDEPGAGMTAGELQHLGRVISRMRDELGLTVLLVAHTMSLVMSISDTISVLDHGVKIAEGAPNEIAVNPQVIEAYLGRPGASASAP